MLGHAIEYLADEFALECRTRGVAQARKHGAVQAIELLMTKNREVYLACPVLPTIPPKVISPAPAFTVRLCVPAPVSLTVPLKLMLPLPALLSSTSFAPTLKAPL